ncbi:MAG: hypothetical protein JJT96_09115 [Opitutales bacterium]|nr:hypothetical protein [Opitutales bacterium]
MSQHAMAGSPAGISIDSHGDRSEDDKQMIVCWQSLWRLVAMWTAVWAALSLEGAMEGQRVFEGLVDSADAAFEAGVRVNEVFAGSFAWTLRDDGVPQLAELEFTVDENHVVGWEGRWRRGDAVEILFSTFPGSEERALYVRWAVYQGERAEHPGWVEFWFAADSVDALAADVELDGYFRLSLFLDEEWAFAKGWFLSHPANAEDADPSLRVAFLEGLVASLRTELAGTLERLAESEEALRQVRAQQSGMVSTIEFLALERQRLEQEVDRLTEELLTRGALPKRIVDLEATLALMETDLDSVREENLRLAELSARAEAARLREREARENAERLLEAVPAAFTVESPPRQTTPLPARRDVPSAAIRDHEHAPAEAETSAGLSQSGRVNARRGSLRR